jgi:RsiW-degrading membrane proteinase PrsW (M82 family)
MNSFNQLASWILMSLGTSMIILFVCISRLQRILPVEPGRSRFLAIQGSKGLGFNLLKAFAFGLILVLVVGSLLIFIKSYWLFDSFWFSPLLEESAKIIVTGYLFTQIIQQGLSEISSARARTFTIGSFGLYGMTLGIGFGLGESLLYSLEVPRILLLRGVTSIVLHGITGAIGGRFLATRMLGKTCFFCGATAIGLHIGYNFLVTLNFPYSYFIFFLLLFFASQILRMFQFQEST